MVRKRKTKKSENKTVKESWETAKVPLEWNIPEYIMSKFATNMVIQLLNNEFKISFFEAKPLINLDPSAPPPKSVRADCITSIIVTADRLQGFIDVMQQQLNNYLSRTH
ncbi:MAG TPA: hypothetical protein VGA80_17935 [Flavobacteriaceae bacterium]|jgi:hypothetical protein